MAREQYKVLCTPLEKDRVYRDFSTDITDGVENIGDITMQVDDGDFDIGVFAFEDVQIRLINDTGSIKTNGKFYDSNSPSSIFKYKRDLAIIEIIYIDKNSNETTVFSGLVNDALSKDNLEDGTTTLTIIGKSSLFNKYPIIGGSVGDGMTTRQALKSILDRPIITDYLNYDANNINPSIDTIINFGSELDNLSYKAALDKIMLASGSVLLIDDNDNIIVKSRDDNGNEPYRFYNAGDPLGRENIINLVNFNNGVQRAFNFFEIDKTVSYNDSLINAFSLRKKKIDVDDIITDLTNRQSITDFYLENFSVPKQELEITCLIEVAKDIDLLDLCTVDYKPILRSKETPFSFPYNMPYILNKRVIQGNIGFKVISKKINLESYTISLKMREIGKLAGDSEV